MGPHRVPAARVSEMPRAGSAERPPGLSLSELEALLFVAERPLPRTEIARLAGVEATVVDRLVDELAAASSGRGIRLVVAGDRVELATAPEAAPLVARYVGHEGPRLSPAALETLAIVAYRQPVTRSIIERIRGVDSDYVLRGLLHRRLVVEIGRAAGPGRPYLYGTAFEFLERFGLSGLDELPVLEPDAAAAIAADATEPSEAAGQERVEAEQGPVEAES